MRAWTVRHDLRNLGLDPQKVTRLERLPGQHGHRLYRVEHDGRPFVIKASGAAEMHEVRCYALLHEHGVPTLPVYGRTDRALLLEDLEASPEWRAAGEADANRAETGTAVAQWYRALHAAGRQLLAGPAGAPAFLRREADELGAEAVLELGARLGMPGNPVWRLAAGCIESLQATMRGMPETLNYNDFHWSNLALSRAEPLRAIVYDYHLLGIGLPYSDCRNVVSALGETARAAFWEAYGPVDRREIVLDRPVSILHALWVAAHRQRFPSWAQGCLRQAQDGGLEAALRRAIEEFQLPAPEPASRRAVPEARRTTECDKPRADGL